MESDFITAFGRLARDLDMAIGITLLEKYENAPRNSLVLFDRFGEQKFLYAKVHTCDFDGVAYLPDSDGSRDTCILQADWQEGIYIAGLDLAQLRDYRKNEVHGNAYRNPRKYALLTDTKICEPFVRKDYRE